MSDPKEVLRGLEQQINEVPAYYRFVMFSDKMPIVDDISEIIPGDYSRLPAHIPVSPLIETENSACVQNRLAEFAVRFSPVEVEVGYQFGYISNRYLFSYDNDEQITRNSLYAKGSLQKLKDTDLKQLADTNYLSYPIGEEPNHTTLRMNKLGLLRLGTLELKEVSIERVVEVSGGENTARSDDGRPQTGEC